MKTSQGREITVTILKSIDTGNTVVSLRGDGIMQYRIKSNAEYSVTDLKSANAAAAILGNGRAYLNLILVDTYVSTDAECRKYAASEESNRYTIADAFVLNSIALKLIGNFYVKVNKPARPTRIFNSEKEALQWLYSFL